MPTNYWPEGDLQRPALWRVPQRMASCGVRQCSARAHGPLHALLNIIENTPPSFPFPEVYGESVTWSCQTDVPKSPIICSGSLSANGGH